MNNTHSKVRLFVTLFFLALFATVKTNATHIFGGELYYTNTTGLQYQVTLVLYGDCAGAAFPSLQGATPTILVYNNSSLYQTMTLTQSGPGVEVTPVCPSQVNSTTCTNPLNTVPGVKRYIYTGNITLNTTSTNWRFDFDGTTGPANAAGRSSTITNIVNPGNSTVALEATLNNTAAGNSSPTYTTVPTPFFCLNKPANYNPGAVDQNGDALSFALVPALIAGGGTATYVAGYSGTNPLASAPGTFSFSGTNGQLAFTPNLVQTSTVVYRITETRNGTVVGTSMREMNFIVLNNCNNNPPGGTIVSSTGGNVLDSITVTVCQSQGLFTFNLNAADLDNNNINLTWAGLPSGAIFTIFNNGTNNPTGIFSWNVTNVTPGVYTFFITYIDDGCPLSSKQTVAYTITVLPKPTIAFSLVSPATCTKKAVFTVTPGVTPNPWTVKATQGSTTFINRAGVTGTITDSLAPGTYVFAVTNANNCLKDTIITIAPPPVITIAAAVTGPLCNGGNDASVTLTGSGGLPPFTYAQGTGAYGSSSTFGGLTAGTYTFHIKDANDCVKDTIVTIIDATPIHAAVTLSKPPCNHFQNGSITIAAFNGTAPYTYAMGTGVYGPSGTFTNLYSGSYTIHIKDTKGCIKDTLVVLPDSVKIQGSAVVTAILCNNGNNGAVTINATGAYPPYTYALGTGTFGTGNVFNGLTAGTYTFHVLDTALCYFDTTLTLTNPTPVTVTAVVANVLCNGAANGTATLTGAGGTPGYTYASGTGTYGSSSTFNGLNVGTYTFHVKDANGCIKDTSISITQPTTLGVTVATDTPSCNGSANGAFTLTGSGGTIPYTYAIGTGAFGSSNNFPGLTAGTYTLHIKDANGCTKDTTITLVQPTAIGVTASVKNSTCTTLSDGKVILVATGGVSPYTYANGSGAYGTSSSFTPLAAGTYTFHVKDSKGCIKDMIIAIIDTIFVTGTVTVTNANCNGTANGSISVTPGGGLSPYTYALNAGTYGTGSTFSSLLAGSYTVHVKDANGCIHDTTVQITQPAVIVPSVVITQPSCNGGANGSINIAATGGTPTYTYALGTGSYGPANNFTGLTAGTYTLHVKDIVGCIHDTSVIVGQPAPLVFTALAISNNLCNGDATGQVAVTATGGTTPYSYAADGNTFQTSSVLTNMLAGTHTIHLKDNNGCTKDSVVTITQPDPVYMSASLKTPTCEGFADGTIYVAGFGGTVPYQYAIGSGNFGNSGIFSGLTEGTYTMHIKDGHGCTHDTTIKLVGYPHIVYNSVIVKGVSCFGDKDGSITFNMGGGNPPFSFEVVGITVPANGNRFENLKTGTYNIEITDSKGCKKDTSILVPTPDLLVLTPQITPNDCQGLDDGGGVFAAVTGGTPPYSYLWSTNPVSITASISGMPNGSYVIKVHDVNNCTDTAIAVVAYDDCCKPFIPDAFTPNGDNRNDYFRLVFKGDMQLEEFSVYNRYGQRLFYTTNLKEGWDGTYSGVKQDLGVYYYYVKAICGNKGDHHVEFKGDVTLIR